MGRRKTAGELAWLRREYPLHDVGETMRLFEAGFGWCPTRASLASWACDEGLASAARATRITWTDEMRGQFAAFVPGHTEGEIRAHFLDAWGVGLTESQIGNAKHALGVRSGTHGGRFEPGHESANKGRAWDEFMSPESQERSRATQFRPGLMPHNGHQPLGTERVSKDGYVEVKVAARKRDPRSAHDNWVPRHRLVWEQANGRPVPDGSIVVFADHDKRNFDPDNLVLMTLAEHGILSAHGPGYADRDTCLAARQCARLTLAISGARRRWKAARS